VPPQVAERSKASLLKFAKALSDLRRSAGLLSLAEFFKEALDRSGYLAHLQETAQIERLENVQEMANEISRWPDQNPVAGLTSYLEDKALLSDADTLVDDDDRVTLITLHAAKGLEFPVVFLVGLEEGLLPHSRAVDGEDPRELEEERRLAYVGITRAMQILYLTHAFRRTRFGQEDFSEPSRFLNALPEAAVERASQAPKISTGVGARPAGRGGYGGNGAYGGANAARWGGSPGTGRNGGASPGGARSSYGGGANGNRPSAEPAALGGFKPGDRVSHEKFGAGQVVNVKNLSDDQDVTIKFADGQIKTLSANFARIQRR
jgi:DNA helicase-2/ATP-dependent DNA helicase PcrA